MKEKVALRRMNKFMALYDQYLHKREEERDEEDLKAFLDGRRDAVFEMCTRSYEEERKKAEEEIAQVNNSSLLLHVISLYDDSTGKREDIECEFKNVKIAFALFICNNTRHQRIMLLKYR